ncbi:isochorismatase family protein [Streptomyces sp. A73]|uniref:cysteine hydrolase family protein n=1 Tax=Streptomyces TaxID=1883 RepID=UPI000C181F5B|nr:MULTISPECIES: isochorismatase family protein [unclassified Streptomyces]MBQ0868451.1 isochorismatase family protein [Streptomyces sp. RK75]MBQ1119482.1 isochorismatase family protein [Streptomyces sp. B15]MBQ1161744.1 isochorismatase family protein [Streptomyces sp. A73]
MHRALLVIDVQESFRARPDSWATLADPHIAGPVTRLVRLARTAGDLVVWVLHTEPGSGGVFDPEQGQVRLLAELDQPLPGEPVLYKTSHNAFTTTNLQQLLTNAGVTELVVSGIRTEQCVETTARLGSDLGYRVSFPVDATTTNPVGGLSAEAVVERTVAVLRDRFARITTVAELEAESAPPAPRQPGGERTTA